MIPENSTTDDRAEALKWWHNMSQEEQSRVIEIWKSLEKEDYRIKWKNVMIATSSSAIETIWKSFKK
jgi:hypothetical protein